MTKSFLRGFVKYTEMSFHYLVFHLLYFTFSKCILLFVSILNAECNMDKRLLLLVKLGGEVGAVPLCHAVVKFGV